MEAHPDSAIELVGIGMSVIDELMVVGEFPHGEGVTEVLESRLQGGGPVPTALVMAARLGARAAMIDRIGGDWRGDLVVREYRASGVNTDHVILEPGKTTTSGAVLVRKRDGARHLVFSPGDFTPLTADELPIDRIRSARLLHLNGRHWPACLEAARVVREAGGEVSFDGGADRYRDNIRDLLPMVDIHISARDFAEKLAGNSDPQAQLAAMLSLGARIAGVTDGERGSWFASSTGESFHQPACAVETVVDTTGCGDVFHGAFLFAHLRGEELKACAAFASAAAALAATALGGRGHLATEEEIRRMKAE